MNIKSKHSQKKLTILAAAMAGVLSLNFLYTIASANEVASNSVETVKVIDSLETLRATNSLSFVNIDLNGDKRVTIKTHDKTYRLKDGERFIEEHNTRRTLTEAESRKMDDLLNKIERYSNSTDHDRGGIFDQEDVYSITYNDDDPSSDIDAIEAKIVNDLEKQIIEKEIIKLRALSMTDGSDEDPEVRIKSALAKINASNDPAVKSAIRSLENAQKQLEESREQMRQDQQRALDQLEQLERITEQG